VRIREEWIENKIEGRGYNKLKRVEREGREGTESDNRQWGIREDGSG